MVQQTRLWPMTLIVMLTIALLGAIVFIVYQNFLAQPTADAKKAPSPDILSEVTTEPLEVTTNLSDETYIKLAVLFQVDNPKAKEELDQRMFQLKDALITSLQSRTKKDVNGDKGLNTLKDELKNKANHLLSSGKVEHVYVTERVTQ